MTLKTDLANELAWGLETTQAAPYLPGSVSGAQKLRIEREYARLHRLLRDLDNQIREWEPKSDAGRNGNPGLSAR